jgi:type 1 glutamine amidotransferase
MLRTNPASDRSARLARVAGAILLASGLALALATAASSETPAASAVISAQDEPDTPVDPAMKKPATKDRVLVFSKTAGFRHDSIPTGVAAIREILAPRYEVDASEDSAVFTDESLKRYRAVVFLSTTGDILDGAQQEAFERFIRAGGGYAGVHAAADTEYSWPWYGQLVGAYFKTHPPTQESTVLVEDRTHRSTRMLPAEWRRTDEWYVYQTNPRGKVRVLASLDDDTVEGVDMGGDHPIAWYHEFDGGRAWYTGGGHTKESFSEPLFRKHLEGGILWAAGAAEEPTQSTPVEGGRPAGQQDAPAAG